MDFITLFLSVEEKVKAFDGVTLGILPKQINPLLSLNKCRIEFRWWWLVHLSEKLNKMQIKQALKCLRKSREESF